MLLFSVPERVEGPVRGGWRARGRALRSTAICSGCIRGAACGFELRVRAIMAHALFIFFFYIFIYIFRARIISTRGSRATLQHLWRILAEQLLHPMAGKSGSFDHEKSIVSASVALRPEASTNMPVRYNP